MAGPFPGVDPYLEFEAPWPDFHGALIAEIRNELGARLPGSYIARVDERIEVATSGMEPPRSFRPDVLVGRFEEKRPAPVSPWQKHRRSRSCRSWWRFSTAIPEELRITWVEIRALPELELVTAIEVLSPINKAWQGRQAYLDKRDKLHAARVNLVEIDLLLGGAPLPMKQRIEPGGYYMIVARGAQLPQAELYRWTVRDPLPALPIPLRAPDADINIDLASLVTRVYDLGRYSRTLRHGVPLPETASLTPDERAWAESVTKRVEQGKG